MRTLAAAGLAMTLSVAGCAAGDATSPADTTGHAGGAENPPTASDAPTPQGDGSIARGVDPYCEAAHAGYLAQLDLLAATDAKSIETGLEDDAGSVDVVNAAGARMLVAIDVVTDQWGTARAQLDAGTWAGDGAGVTTSEADEAFADVFHYIDVYARPEAQIVAEVGSISEYDAAMMRLLAEPGAAESIDAGAAALGTVISYTRERCGPLPEA